MSKLFQDKRIWGGTVILIVLLLTPFLVPKSSLLNNRNDISKEQDKPVQERIVILADSADRAFFMKAIKKLRKIRPEIGVTLAFDHRATGELKPDITSSMEEDPEYVFTHGVYVNKARVDLEYVQFFLKQLDHSQLTSVQ